MLGSLVTPVAARGAAAVQPEEQQLASEQALGEEVQVPDAMDAIPDMPTEDANNIFTKDNIQKLILQDMMGNEGKNISQLLALYKAFGADGGQQKTNATTQKALTQSANGESTISQLEQLLGNAGGGQGNVGGSLAGLLGGIGLNDNAKAYNDLSTGSVAQIAKALGETGALSDSDIATYGAMLPKLTDPEGVARKKIAALRERLQNATQNTATYGGGSDIDLTDLMGE